MTVNSDQVTARAEDLQKTSRSCVLPLGLHEFQSEAVAGASFFTSYPGGRAPVARVSGVSQEPTLFGQLETCTLDFRDDHLLVNAVQCLGLGRTSAASPTMINHNIGSTWP